MAEELESHSQGSLKQFTAARIGIGHTGVSVPLQQSLAFKLAHAHARDAVYSELAIDALTKNLAPFGLPVLSVHSKAENRYQYLQRPDFGRTLNEQSKPTLADFAGDYDIAIIIADGLSAAAVNQNAVEVLGRLIPQLTSAGFKIAPLILAEQGRVALADEIASLLQARMSIIFIGERPGLSAADSMGAYLTYQPRPGLTDDSRNCISNIRPGGMDADTATQKIFYLVKEAFRLQLSGVGLKDNAGLLG